MIKAGHSTADVAMKQEAIEEKIESIVYQIVSRYKPLRIILFGSAGRREYDTADDLDFLIIKDDVPLYGIERVREIDALIERDIAVDILVYSSDEFEERLRLNDPFIKTIFDEGRIVYG